MDTVLSTNVPEVSASAIARGLKVGESHGPLLPLDGEADATIDALVAPLREPKLTSPSCPSRLCAVMLMHPRWARPRRPVPSAFTPTIAGGAASADAALVSGASVVVAFNDLLALGLIGRLAERGVRVPAQISVVGYDNIFGLS